MTTTRKCDSMDRERKPRVSRLHRFTQEDGGIFYVFMGYTVGPFVSEKEREEHIRNYYDESS